MLEFLPKLIQTIYNTWWTVAREQRSWIVNNENIHRFSTRNSTLYGFMLRYHIRTNQRKEVGDIDYTKFEYIITNPALGLLRIFNCYQTFLSHCTTKMKISHRTV